MLRLCRVLSADCERMTPKSERGVLRVVLVLRCWKQGRPPASLAVVLVFGQVVALVLRQVFRS